MCIGLILPGNTSHRRLRHFTFVTREVTRREPKSSPCILREWDGVEERTKYINSRRNKEGRDGGTRTSGRLSQRSGGWGGRSVGHLLTMQGSSAGGSAPHKARNSFQPSHFHLQRAKTSSVGFRARFRLPY